MAGRIRIRSLLLLPATVLYCLGALFCQSVKADADLTYILLSQSIGAARAEEIFRQEALLADSVGVCFWGEAGKQTVSCKETGGAAQVTQVLLSGNPALMDAGVLAWQDGCFLDEDTARKLFGTALCGEQTLWRDGRPCRVFGTVPALQPTMLTVAAEKDGSVLNRCVLSVPAESAERIAGQFLLRWGLQGELVDFYPVWALVHNFLLLFPGVLLLRGLADGAKRFEALPFPDRIRPGLFLLTVLCLLCFLGSRVVILQVMIPSRWSDFSFWSQFLEAQEENFRLIMLTPMGDRHLQMLLDMVKSLACSIAAFVLALWSVSRK